MTDETVVAVYERAEQASEAVRELEAAGVPSSAISQHRGSGTTGVSGTTAASTATAPTATPPVREKGFWASLFGAEPEYEHDTTVYDRSLEAGATVVTVRASEQHLLQVTDILERHNPIDIDERAASYGAAQATPVGTAGTSSGVVTDSTVSDTGGRLAAAGGPVLGTDTTISGANRTVSGADRAVSDTTRTAAGDGEAIPLSEETLAVGKRAINRGTTRIRRYVVETPVQEQVNLRDETVSVERRPVSGTSPVTNPDFTDKVIEVTETAEEAVVSKSARVREEVVVRKEATERTETVRDTVRREDVEITKDAGTERSTRDVNEASTRDLRDASASTIKDTSTTDVNEPPTRDANDASVTGRPKI